MPIARPLDASSKTGFLEEADFPEIKSSKMQAFLSNIASKLLSLALSPSAKASLIGVCVVVGGVLCSNPITIAVTAIAGAIFGFYCYKNWEGIKKELGRPLSRRISKLSRLFSNRIDMQYLLDQTKDVQKASKSSQPMIQAAYRIRYENKKAHSFKQSPERSEGVGIPWPKICEGFDDLRENHTYTEEQIEILSDFEKKVH